MTDRPVDFLEVQRFRRWWFALIVVIPVVVMWWGFVTQIVLGKEWGSKPASDVVVWLLWVLLGIGLPVWLWNLGVKTTVDRGGVHVRWIAFPYRRAFAFGDIEHHEVVSYNPIREFGGWGIRRGRQGRVAYSVRGDQGVELRLGDGRLLVIGSQRPGELDSAISKRA